MVTSQPQWQPQHPGTILSWYRRQSRSGHLDFGPGTPDGSSNTSRKSLVPFPTARSSQLLTQREGGFGTRQRQGQAKTGRSWAWTFSAMPRARSGEATFFPTHVGLDLYGELADLEHLLKAMDTLCQNTHTQSQGLTDPCTPRGPRSSPCPAAWVMCRQDSVWHALGAQ